MSGQSALQQVFETYQILLCRDAKTRLQAGELEGRQWYDFLSEHHKQYLMPTLVAIVQQHQFGVDEWQTLAGQYQKMMATCLNQLGSDADLKARLQAAPQLIFQFMALQRDNPIIKAICKKIAGRAEMALDDSSYFIPWPLSLTQGLDFQTFAKDDLVWAIQFLGRDQTQFIQHHPLINHLISILPHAELSPDDIQSLWQLFATERCVYIAEYDENKAMAIKTYFDALSDLPYDPKNEAKALVQQHLALSALWVHTKGNKLKDLFESLSDDDLISLLQETIEHVTKADVIEMSKDSLASLLGTLARDPMMPQVGSLVRLMDSVRCSHAHSLAVLEYCKPMLSAMIQAKDYGSLTQLIQGIKNKHLIGELIDFFESQTELKNNPVILLALCQDHNFALKLKERLSRSESTWMEQYSSLFGDDQNRQNFLSHVDAQLIQSMLAYDAFKGKVEALDNNDFEIVITRDFNRPLVESQVAKRDFSIEQLTRLLPNDDVVKQNKAHAKLVAQFARKVSQSISPDDLNAISLMIRQYPRTHHMQESFKAVLKAAVPVYENTEAMQNLFGLGAEDTPAYDGSIRLLMAELFKNTHYLNQFANDLFEMTDVNLLAALQSLSQPLVKQVMKAHKKLQRRLSESHNEKILMRLVQLDVDRKLTRSIIASGRIKTEENFFTLLASMKEDSEVCARLLEQAQGRDELLDDCVVYLATKVRMDSLLPLIAEKASTLAMIGRLFNDDAVLAAPDACYDTFNYLRKNDTFNAAARSYITPKTIIDMLPREQFSVEIACDFILDSQFGVAQDNLEDNIAELLKKFDQSPAFLLFLLHNVPLDIVKALDKKALAAAYRNLLCAEPSERRAIVEPNTITLHVENKILDPSDWYDILNDEDFTDPDLKRALLNACIAALEFDQDNIISVLDAFAKQLSAPHRVYFHAYLMEETRRAQSQEAAIFLPYLKQVYASTQAHIEFLQNPELLPNHVIYYVDTFIRGSSAFMATIFHILAAIPSLSLENTVALLGPSLDHPAELMTALKRSKLEPEQVNQVENMILVCIGLARPSDIENPDIKPLLFKVLSNKGEGIFAEKHASTIRDRLIKSTPDVINLVVHAPETPRPVLDHYFNRSDASTLKEILQLKDVPLDVAALAVKRLMSLPVGKVDMASLLAVFTDRELIAANGASHQALCSAIARALSYQCAQDQAAYFYPCYTQALSTKDYFAAQNFVARLGHARVTLSEPYFCEVYNDQFYVSKAWYDQLQALRQHYDRACARVQSDGTILIQDKIFTPDTPDAPMRPFLLTAEEVSAMKACVESQAKAPVVEAAKSFALF